MDVLDVDGQAKTAASSENSGRKSTENEQNKRKRSIVILEDDEIEEFQSKQVAKNCQRNREKPGTTSDIVRSSCCQVSTKLLQVTY